MSNDSDREVEQREIEEWRCPKCGWLEPEYQSGDPALCPNCGVEYPLNRDERIRNWSRCTEWNDDGSKCDRKTPEEHCHDHKEIATDGGQAAKDIEQGNYAGFSNELGDKTMHKNNRSDEECVEHTVGDEKTVSALDLSRDDAADAHELELYDPPASNGIGLKWKCERCGRIYADWNVFTGEACIPYEVR